jgi:signal transduction histidine kinase
VPSLRALLAACARLLPARTVRLRLTLLYGALFAVSGACLFTVAYTLIVSGSPSQYIAVQPRTAEPGGTAQGSGLPGLPSRQPSTATAHAMFHWTGLDHVLAVSGIALAIMTAISLVVGWFVAGRILRPLRAMITTARSISDRDLHQRLAVPGPRDELKNLGDTIDGLLDRLQTVVTAQRQFAANASHELRTPLTLQRTLLESVLTHPRPAPAAWRSACERALAATQKQAQLIEALLTLARSQQSPDHREPIDLASLTAGAIRTLEPQAAARGVTIQTALESTCISGVSDLIERLVSNVLDNAIRHNIPNGQVWILVHDQAGEACLQVTNTGPVIPADQIGRLLQPFQRLGPQRAGQHDGVGLGLSIIAAIASAHTATLSAHPAPHGGLDIRITFPPADHHCHQARTSRLRARTPCAPDHLATP